MTPSLTTSATDLTSYSVKKKRSTQPRTTSPTYRNPQTAFCDSEMEESVCSYNQPLYLASLSLPSHLHKHCVLQFFPFSLIIVSFSLSVESIALQINIIYIQKHSWPTSLSSYHPICLLGPKTCGHHQLQDHSLFSKLQWPFCPLHSTHGSCQSSEISILINPMVISVFTSPDRSHISLLESLLFFAFRTPHSHEFLCFAENSSQNWLHN